MITKILPFLNNIIPTGLAFKGLSKINPKIGKYLAAATAAGYGAEEAIGYLRDQLGGEDNSQGLRPDEQAANSRVSQSGQIPKAIGKAAQVGASAAGYGLAASAVPEVIGGLFGGSADQAASPDNKQAQVQQGQSQTQQSPENQEKSIIHQFAPKLGSLIEEAIGSGRTIDEVEAIAKSPGNGFSKVVAHMEKTLGMPFYDILRSIYGGPKRGPSQQAQPQQAQASQQAQSQQPNLPAQQQMGAGEARLTQALERLAKMRGG